MRKTLNIGIISIITLFTYLFISTSCSSDDDDDDDTTTTTTSDSGTSTITTGSLTLSFTKKAANSLPQIKSTGSSLHLVATGNISTTTMANFFKQECYMPSDDGSSYTGFCPNDTKSELDTALQGSGIGDGTTIFNKYKLTSTTLIGLIYHAQLYSQGPGLSNTCSTYSASDLATANSPTYTGTNDPDKFIIDYNSMLSCVKTNESNGETTYSTFGYNGNEDYPAIANLTARYGLAYNNVADKQTDIFQIYLGLDKSTVNNDTPTPTFLAFNFVSAGGLRAIILANLVDNLFAVRYATATQQIIAVGKGGVNEETGAAISGYYIAKDITASNTYCVNNATGEYDDTTYANCTTTIDFWDSMSADNVATYLKMNDVDKEKASGFLAFFTNTDTLNAALIPTSDYTEDKKDFPSKIE